MANETTRTSSAALIATEALAKRSIVAALPRMTMLHLVHQDSINGLRTSSKRYTVESDLGAAGAGIEGVDLTPTVEITMGSSVTVTPTEVVADMALVTEADVMDALGVDSDTARNLTVEGTQQQWMTVLQPFIERLIPRGLETIENLLLALMAGASQTAGSSGVDCSIANLLAARYTYRINQPTRPVSECIYLLAENQAQEVDLEAISASGGVDGTIWTQQADYSLSNKQDPRFEVDGFLGTFLRYPTFTYDYDLLQMANAGADVVGGFGCPGVPGRAPDDPGLGGRPGAYVWLERAGLKVRMQGDLSMRGIEVVMNAIGAAAEVCDRAFVGLVTDAP